MDHRSMYKKTGMVGSNNRRAATRAQDAKRTETRRNAFDNHREISPIQEPAQPIEILTKQQRHYAKFLEWRQQKKENNSKTIARQRPFTSAVPRNQFLSPQESVLKSTKKAKPSNLTNTYQAIYSTVGAGPVSPPRTRSRSGVLNMIPTDMPIKQPAASERSKTPKKAPLSPAKKTMPPIKAKKRIVVQPPMAPPQIERKLRTTSTKLQKASTPAKTKATTTKTNGAQVNVPLTPVPNSYGALASSTAQKNGRPSKPAARIEDLFSPIETTQTQVRRSNVKAAADAKTEQPPPLQMTPPLEVTPLNNTAVDTSINYVSPFVTTSRGKGSARKERTHRDSVYRLELNRSTEESVEKRRRKEAALYFRRQVTTESNRLLALVADWDAYSRQYGDVIESEYVDQIDVAIGQTRLLVTKKFNQFRTLVDQCEECADEAQPVLAEDLEGFWSMVYLQVENCEARFKNLDTLKANNWVDVELAVNTATGVVRKLRKPKPAKMATSSSTASGKLLLQKLHKARVELELNRKLVQKAMANLTPGKTPNKSLLANVLDQEAVQVVSGRENLSLKGNIPKSAVKSARTKANFKVVFTDEEGSAQYSTKARAPKTPLLLSRRHSSVTANPYADKTPSNATQNVMSAISSGWVSDRKARKSYCNSLSSNVQELSLGESPMVIPRRTRRNSRLIF